MIKNNQLVFYLLQIQITIPDARFKHSFFEGI